MTTTTAPTKPALSVGSIVATPHHHTGHCQRWSVCDGAQQSRVTGLHGTTATVVSRCGLVQILWARDLTAVEA